RPGSDRRGRPRRLGQLARAGRQPAPGRAGGDSLARARRALLQRDRHPTQMLGDGGAQAGQPRPGPDPRAAQGDRIGVSDYLDRLEAQLTKLTEEGAHQGQRAPRTAVTASPRRTRQTRTPRGPRRRRGARRGSEMLAVLAAAAVVVAVVAIVLGNVHTGKPRLTSAGAKHSTTAQTSRSTPVRSTTTNAAPPPAPP